MSKVDDLLAAGQQFADGYQKGREDAIKNYDKALLELMEIMERIEKKIGLIDERQSKQT